MTEISSTYSEKDRADTGKEQPGTADGEIPRLETQERSLAHVQHIPWRFKIAAGSMIMLFAFGSSLSESTFGPLKSTLVKELGITSKFYFGHFNIWLKLLRCAVWNHRKRF
jgi:hypothetical protein